LAGSTFFSSALGYSTFFSSTLGAATFYSSSFLAPPLGDVPEAAFLAWSFF
jgi:hypothetical protein